MNDQSKLSQSIFLSVITGEVSYVAHLFKLAGDVAMHHAALLIAVVVGGFSIWASVETALYRRKQRKKGSR